MINLRIRLFSYYNRSLSSFAGWPGRGTATVHYELYDEDEFVDLNGNDEVRWIIF